MVKSVKSRKAARKGKKTRRAMRGGGAPTHEDVQIIKDYLNPKGDGRSHGHAA
jgi:hypothetical protein